MARPLKVKQPRTRGVAARRLSCTIYGDEMVLGHAGINKVNIHTLAMRDPGVRGGREEKTLLIKNQHNAIMQSLAAGPCAQISHSVHPRLWLQRQQPRMRSYVFKPAIQCILALTPPAGDLPIPLHHRNVSPKGSRIMHVL